LQGIGGDFRIVLITRGELMADNTKLDVNKLVEALEAWMKYAETNYSGDGMDALKLTRIALNRPRK
jgi:hypothetical protein